MTQPPTQSPLAQAQEQPAPGYAPAAASQPSQPAPLPPAQSFSAPPAQPAPTAPPAPDYGFPALVQPAAPAAALDVGVPLAMPQAPPPPPPPNPQDASAAQPAAAAAVPAGPPAHAPINSPAMPVLDEDAGPVQAFPEFAQAIERPDPIGGVSAADAADIRDLHARRAPAQAPVAAASGTIWSPATALILVMVAVTVQVVAVYAREALPKKVNTGQPLDQFEVLVQSLPVIDTMAASYLAMAFGLGATLLMLLGAQRGIRDLPLQVAVGVLGVLAIAGSWGFSMLAG